MPSIPAPTAPFEPPGPGSWILDTAHFPRPATPFVIELFPEPARRGFTEATASYGLLLDHIEWAFVHRWAYLCPRPAWAMEAPLTRDRWRDLVHTTPVLGERLATSARVFVDRRWREDVRRWDEQVKPRLRRRYRELQAVEPDRLTVDGLLAHLDRCREHLRGAIRQHHRLNVAPVIPAGDFLVHGQEWVGCPPAELIPLVASGEPIRHEAADQIDRLDEALQDDPSAGALVAAGGEPADVLATLLAWPGEVAHATADYLDVVGDWSVGSGADVAEPCMRELPNLLVEMIASRLGGAPHAVAERAAHVRAEVPSGRRAEFDELLAEARATHRVRDERAIYCDVWAYGLARRAILAAGRRLATVGAVEAPEHLVQADHAEMRSLLRTGSGPHGAELAARARYREDADEERVPTTLGDPPRSPVPTEWLPSGADRTERAFRTYVGAMSGAPEMRAPTDRAPTGLVRGQSASPGTYEGRARVVRSAGELAILQRGDVLVTSATTPAFNVVLPLVGAIVTDRGGMLSHAAIVAGNTASRPSSAPARRPGSSQTAHRCRSMARPGRSSCEGDRLGSHRRWTWFLSSPVPAAPGGFARRNPRSGSPLGRRHEHIHP